MRKLRHKYTAPERRQSEQQRDKVFDFMKRFNSKCLWEIDGPMNTSIDWMLCFSYEGGVALVTTYCGGTGWDIYTMPCVFQDLDRVEQAMREQVAGRVDQGNRWINPAYVAPLLLTSLEKLLPEIDSEIEQRKHSGNAEDWAQLEQLSCNAHAVVKMAKDGPLGENLAERQIIDEENRDNVALLDFISDKIGLPNDQELSRENFLAWLSTQAPRIVSDDTDYKTLFFKARDLLNDNAAAWDGEEDSVKEEHAELIVDNENALGLFNQYMTDEQKSDQYWESNTGHDAEGKPLGGVDPGPAIGDVDG